MKETPLVTPLMNLQQPRTQSRVAFELTQLLSDQPTRQLLQKRYLLGTLRQFSVDSTQPKENTGEDKSGKKNKNDGFTKAFSEFSRLRSASREHGIGIFLLRAAGGEVIGLGSVQSALELRRYREFPVVGALPLPPRFAHRTPLVIAESTEGSAVEAWTAPGYVKELQDTYRMLADPNGIAKESHTGTTSWTVEPKDAPNWVHTAIELAGYMPQKAGHFEHDKSRMETPPRSVLYQRIQTA